MGSSPHSQGTGPLMGDDVIIRRIIPALAGNRSPVRETAPLPKDHPRTRREQAASISDLRRSVGSSPHSQGTVEPAPMNGSRTGIIPALAGNSCARRAPGHTCRDHPRTRREQVERSAGAR